MCKISFLNGNAILDYASIKEHLDFNSINGFDLGQLKIQFDKFNEGQVSKIQWRDDDQDNFSAAPVRVRTIDDDGMLASGNFEGAQRLVTHLASERKPAIRARKVEDVLGKGLPLSCEACGFDFGLCYPGIGDGFCEVHHKIWLADGERDTQLADLAILCANCHRMIHRTDRLSVEAFSQLLKREHFRSLSTRPPAGVHFSEEKAPATR
jgi:predicted HNH restriction endonuclease